MVLFVLASGVRWSANAHPPQFSQNTGQETITTEIPVSTETERTSVSSLELSSGQAPPAEGEKLSTEIKLNASGFSTSDNSFLPSNSSPTTATQVTDTPTSSGPLVTTTTAGDATTLDAELSPQPGGDKHVKETSATSDTFARPAAIAGLLVGLLGFFVLTAFGLLLAKRRHRGRYHVHQARILRSFTESVEPI